MSTVVVAAVAAAAAVASSDDGSDGSSGSVGDDERDRGLEGLHGGSFDGMLSRQELARAFRGNPRFNRHSLCRGRKDFLYLSLSSRSINAEGQIDRAEFVRVAKHLNVLTHASKHD